MISIIDTIVILLTLIFIVAVAVRRSIGLTLEDYWVNKRKTSKFILICSTLSTSIGAGTVVAIVSMSYKGGFIGAILGFCNALGLFLLGCFLAAKIRKISAKYKCYTLGDILELRFSRKCRFAIGIVNLVVYFFFLAAQLLAFGAFIKIVTNWDYFLSLVAASVIIFIYVFVGGLKSDFFTDLCQFFLLLILAVALPIFLFLEFGNLNSMYTSLKSLPWNYLTGISYAGWPFLIGAILFFTPSILVMMDTWQRIFAAENEETAKKSLMLSGLFIFPLFFLFSLIGVFAYILFPELDPNTATPYMIKEVLPIGLIGVAFSGFIAALMSTADSMLIVASTTAVKDFYHSLIYKEADEKHLLRVSRVASLFIGFISLAFALAFPDIVRVAISGFSSLIILIPGVIGGLLWQRATSKAAFWSILVGFCFVCSVLLFIPQYADYAFIPGFILSCFVFIVLSFLTKHEQEEKPHLWYGEV